MKTLVLLCDNYPLTAGEFFLDDEIKIIHPHFEKIHVLINDQEQQNLNRFIPNNIEITKYKSDITINDKLKAVPKIFSVLFIFELYRAIFKLKIAPKPILFKIMFMDIVRSNQIIWELKKLIATQKLDLNNSIFYSYWHDYRALALARLTKRNRYFKTISRAHSSDIFSSRSSINYLSFKTYILSNLQKTITISYTGKEYLRFRYKEINDKKVVVSRLGKNNLNLPLFEKNETYISICSCSHFNKIKRVHLIVEILSELKELNVKWNHFGWGPQENYVKGHIEKHYPNLNYKFWGQVDNQTVMSYYCNNYIDLFINVSESEGIPFSIMEALSAGIPVIATDVGGTREAVPEEVGFLLKKDFDVKYAANLIRQYLNLTKQEQETYRKNAFSFWHENFNAEKNYSAFAQLLQNL